MAEPNDVPEELLRFNAFLAEEAEAKRRDKQARKAAAQAEQRVAEAEAVKQKAAERIRTLNASERATREQKAEADQAYRDAIEALRRAVAGEPEPSGTGESTDEQVDVEPAALDEQVGDEAPVADGS